MATNCPDFVVHRSITHVRAEGRAISAAQSYFTGPGLPAPKSRQCVFGIAHNLFSRCQLQDVASDRFLRRPAIKPLCEPVPVQDDTGQIGRDHGFMNGVEQACLEPDLLHSPSSVTFFLVQERTEACDLRLKFSFTRFLAHEFTRRSSSTRPSSWFNT